MCYSIIVETVKLAEQKVACWIKYMQEQCIKMPLLYLKKKLDDN